MIFHCTAFTFREFISRILRKVVQGKMKPKWNVPAKLGEMLLFASVDLCPCLKKKKKNLPKNTSDLTSLKSSLRKSSLPRIDLFLQKQSHSVSWLHWWKTGPNGTFQKFTVEPSLSDLGLEWDTGWRGGRWWGLRRKKIFVVKRNRLHSWILHHVINKTKHTAFLPKHMALFLKHRSGLPWNLVFVSVLFFLLAWDLL